MRTSLSESGIDAAQVGKTMQKLLKTGCQSPGIVITGQKNRVAEGVDQTFPKFCTRAFG